MTQSTQKVSLTDKNGMITELAKEELSSSDAHLVCELALHAKNQAMNSIKAVGESAPNHLQSLIIALAVDVTATALQNAEVQTMIGIIGLLGIERAKDALA